MLLPTRTVGRNRLRRAELGSYRETKRARVWSRGRVSRRVSFSDAARRRRSSLRSRALSFAEAPFCFRACVRGGRPLTRRAVDDLHARARAERRTEVRAAGTDYDELR